MFEAARTRDALLAFDERMKVVAWSADAERITGFTAEEVVGKPCWEVFGAVDPDGNTVCSRDCVRWHKPLDPEELLIRTDRGPRPVHVATTQVGGRGRRFWVHTFR